MKRTPMPMTSGLGGHMSVPLEKKIEEIDASALHYREWASMRANDPSRKLSGRCSAFALSSDSYGELGHHT
jgi:hypothetical protein